MLPINNFISQFYFFLIFMMLPRLALLFKQKNYLYANQLLICDEDPNFNSKAEQHSILSKLVNYSKKVFRNTPITVAANKLIKSMPKFSTFKKIILPNNSPLCSGNIHIDDRETLRMISNMPELSLVYVNIAIVPHRIIKYFNGDGIPLNGLADYGGAYLPPIKTFPFGIKTKNIIFVSSSILKTDGFSALLQLFLHEIGHTFVPKEFFGVHDPDDESYNVQVDGTFIMSKYRLNIQGVNNLSKYNYWFYEEPKLCGNGIIDYEADEQCECNSNIPNDSQICDCGTCRLKRQFKCINTANMCCNRFGRIAKKGIKCGSEELRLCLKEQYCDGVSADCPESDHHDEGTRCDAGKVCSSTGACVSDKCLQQEYDCLPNNPCMFGCSYQNSTVEGCVERFSKKDGAQCVLNGNIGYCEKSDCLTFPTTLEPFQLPETVNDHSSAYENYEITIVGVIFFVFVLLGAFVIYKNRSYLLNLLNKPNGLYSSQ